MSKKYTVVGLGELLWDLFPDRKRLGGAPANFAYITSLLGDQGIPASRLGSDELGAGARRRLRELGLTDEFVQEDATHATGTVQVELDASGQPRFEITESVAWDYLEWTPQWCELAEKAEAVCFGTLAQRSETSRTTMRSFLQATRPGAVRVCDINLRQHFFSKQIVQEAIGLSTIIKLNHEELPRVIRLLGLEENGQPESARQLLEIHHLKMVCVTRGNEGSLLISPDASSEHPGFKVKVADTVGAGDAFTAALVHGYLRGAPLDQINESANRVGAWVASQPGATPTPKGDLEKSLREIK